MLRSVVHDFINHVENDSASFCSISRFCLNSRFLRSFFVGNERKKKQAEQKRRVSLPRVFRFSEPQNKISSRQITRSLRFVSLPFYFGHVLCIQSRLQISISIVHRLFPICHDTTSSRFTKVFYNNVTFLLFQVRSTMRLLVLLFRE